MSESKTAGAANPRRHYEFWRLEVRDLVESDVYIVSCVTARCGHWAIIPIELLQRRFRPTEGLRELPYKMRCTGCGKRGGHFVECEREDVFGRQAEQMVKEGKPAPHPRHFMRVGELREWHRVEMICGCPKRFTDEFSPVTLKKRHSLQMPVAALGTTTRCRLCSRRAGHKVEVSQIGRND